MRASHHPFRHFFGGLVKNDPGPVGADHAHGQSFDADFAGENVGAPARDKIFLDLDEFGIIGNGLKKCVALDPMVGGGGEHIVHSQWVGLGRFGLIPVQMQGLGPGQRHQFPDFGNGLGLVGTQVIGPARNLRVDPGAA